MLDAVTEHLDLWSSAHTTKSTSGRGSGNKLDLYGIKKLRELILELAVRGKLVPQDPADEPASVLLEKIAAEKARLVKEEKLKTTANPVIPDGDKYLVLPESWSYCRLGNLAKFIDYRGKTPKKISSGIRLITAKNIRFGYIANDPEEYISSEEYREWMTRGFPRKGDLLFTPEAPLGNVAIVDLNEKFALAQRAICFQLHETSMGEFLKLVIMSPAFRAHLVHNATGMTATGIKASKLKEIPIPVPPLAEQHRIVTKVNELMTLCDTLEQQETGSIAAHQTLVENLLATLTSSTTAQELADNCNRLAEHFDTLFTTDHSIEHLRQTILQLAVMGRLVPQDPTDEPASVLLEKISAEKARLVKEKKIKKQKSLPPISDDEKPFELPVGWEWSRLGDLTNRIGSGSTPRGGKAAYTETGIPFLRSQNIWNHGLELRDVAYIPEKTHEKMANTTVLPGDVLLNITGASLGRCTVFPTTIPEANVSQHVTVIRPSLIETNDYLHLCILSPYIQSLVWRRQVGMAREGLSKKVLELFEFPVPPMAQQHRIVTKVNELMTLCDTLQTQAHQAQTTRLHLADAMVDQALTTHSLVKKETV